jgi:hypothetical protein
MHMKQVPYCGHTWRTGFVHPCPKRHAAGYFSQPFFIRVDAVQGFGRNKSLFGTSSVRKYQKQKLGN